LGLFRAILRALARLPLAWLHRAGAWLGWIIYWSAPGYAARLRDNISVSGICTDPAARMTLTRRAVAEAGKSVAELPKLWFGPDEQVSGLVTCNTWAVVEEARRAARGILFLTPHLGCFEISAAYGAQRLPLTVMYRPPKLRWLEPVMLEGRTRWSARLAPATLAGVRTLLKALKRGEAVGLLPDQAPGAGEGTWAPFFGRPAYTMTLATRLQRSTGAAVIMAFAERLARGGYELHLEAVPTDGFDEAALNRAIEAVIRRCPEQYLWSYNRYKVPAGVEPPSGSVVA
jgi:KDO2-lipid IV(A) lauroyltransferase